MKLKPTKQQLAFLDWEFGVFFHFGIRKVKDPMTEPVGLIFPVFHILHEEVALLIVVGFQAVNSARLCFIKQRRSSAGRIQQGRQKRAILKIHCF